MIMSVTSLLVTWHFLWSPDPTKGHNGIWWPRDLSQVTWLIRTVLNYNSYWTTLLQTPEQWANLLQLRRLNLLFIIFHFLIFLSEFPHCPKSNKNFRYIARNVEENMVLHEIFRVVSRFPIYIPCYIAENQRWNWKLSKHACLGQDSIAIIQKLSYVL